MTHAGVWLKPNETQVSSNSEAANSYRIWLLKTPIHLKVSIKRGEEGLYCFKLDFSHPFYPLENLRPCEEPSLEDLL